MRLVQQSFEVITPSNEDWLLSLKRIERMARICYKSEDLITRDGSSARKIIKMLVEKEHGAMIEHSTISVVFTTSRGVTHELVRHRLASYAQESTRYCNYSKEKFSNEIVCIDPRPAIELDPKMSSLDNRLKDFIVDKIVKSYEQDEKRYLELVAMGVSAQIARDILPTGLKTEIGLTCNLRELQHIFKMRCAKNAHPAMRSLMIPFQQYMQERLPEIFGEPHPTEVS